MANVLNAIPYPPFFRTLDEETNRKISDLCSSLHLETGTLQGCMALFDHVLEITNEIRQKIRSDFGNVSEGLEREDRITKYWPFIAAREALSSVYNFHWALKELNSIIIECPDRASLPKPKGVEAAFAKFDKQFNKAILARHAASHRTEISNNFEKNSHDAALSSGPVVKPKGSQVMMSDCLVDRTYTGTRKGEMLKFDVTWETFAIVLETYHEVIRSVFAEDR